MKKNIFLFLLIAIFAGKVFSENIRTGVLNGPSGIPMAYVMENIPELNGKKVTYETYAAANQLLPKLIKGELDIGFLPPNVAAKVYNANNGCVVMAAVSGNGMLSLITKDKKIKTLKDLKGKTVTVAGQGATPDYIFRYLLEKNKISTGENDKKKVELNFSIPPQEIAAALIAGKIDYAVVPESFATIAVEKDKSVFKAISLQEEFKRIQGSAEYPMTVIAVNARFAKENPEVVKDFLSSYKEASEWTVMNPEAAGKLVEKYNIGLTKEIASKAIPECAFTYKDALQSRNSVESFLRIFLSFEPASTGGKLPDDGFYFQY